MPSEPLAPPGGDPPVFAELRDRIQAHLLAGLPAHVDRLGRDTQRLRAWQRDRLRGLLAVAKRRSAFHAGRLRGVDPARFELAGPLKAPVQLPPASIAFVAASSAVHGTVFVSSILAGTPVRIVHVPVTLPVPEIVGRLNQLQPRLLFGYASMLARLAAEHQAGRLRIAPQLVSCTAETLIPEFRAAIKGAFGVPIMNTFGSTEGLAGSSGPDDPDITLADDGCITELVDASYRPVPPGTPCAKVLVTNLYHHLQPLIRYELGDSFTRQPDSPGCAG